MNAQTAAREIHDEFFQELPDGMEDNEEIIESELERIAVYIQQAIDAALTQERERYMKLAETWAKNAETLSPLSPCYKAFVYSAQTAAKTLRELAGGSP